MGNAVFNRERALKTVKNVVYYRSNERIFTMSDTLPFREIEAVVREAAGMIRAATVRPSDIHAKDGPANYVTEYDTRIQRFLIARFSELVPGAAFFGEEETEGCTREVSAGRTFFIDPIDGTTNFMFGYRYSCVSVGLAEAGRVTAGWVCNPYSDEMFSARRGEGAFLNGARLRIADRGLADGIAVFDIARYNDDDNGERIFAAAKELYRRAIAIRCCGSAALDLCRIAAGANVGYFQTKLQPYDYAAASVIVEEAGGVIGQLAGEPIALDGPCPIIAGTPHAAEEIRNIVRELK